VAGSVDCVIECAAKIAAATLQCLFSGDKLQCIIGILTSEAPKCIVCVGQDDLETGSGAEPTPNDTEVELVGGNVDCAIECAAKIAAAALECLFSHNKLQCIIGILTTEAPKCIACVGKDDFETGSGAEPTFNETGQALEEMLVTGSVDCVIECAAKIAAATLQCFLSSDKLQCIIGKLKTEAPACIACVASKTGSGTELTFNVENGQTLGETLRATCDDVMKVYFDGVLQSETAGMRNWPVTSYLNIPTNTRVLAIECKNLGAQEGILASTTTGLKTDASWLCSKIQVGGWTLPNFVPTYDFAPANREGTNGVAPWGARPGILVQAEWIWPAGTSTNEAYCRIEL